MITLYQIINKPDFPSLADEIAKPRPDMNILVAAFTVSEKSINTMLFKSHEHIYILTTDGRTHIAIIENTCGSCNTV